MGEYLEGLFERAFDREVGQEERVFNTLSFFVAAMALTINVLGYISTKLPAFALSAYSLTTFALMTVAASLMVAVMWALFDGVRERIYRFLSYRSCISAIRLTMLPPSPSSRNLPRRTAVGNRSRGPKHKRSSRPNSGRPGEYLFPSDRRLRRLAWPAAASEQ